MSYNSDRARSLILDSPKLPFKVPIIFFLNIFFGALMDSLALLCADHLEVRSSKIKYGFFIHFCRHTGQYLWNPKLFGVFC